MALAVLVSALLLVASYRAHYHASIVHSQATTLHPLHIVRSPQLPKIVRPVPPAAVPVSSPGHHFLRLAAPQHKA